MKITFFSGFGYWKKLGPKAHLQKGSMLGGGETSLIELATALGKRKGVEVTVIGDVEKVGRFGKVNWMQWPGEEGVPEGWQADPCDVFIACDAPGALMAAENATLRLLDCQNNHFIIAQVEHMLDVVVARSEWHGDTLESHDPNITHQLRWVMPNGIRTQRFDTKRKIEREPLRCMYSSSPDRGLHHLCRIWPKVREALPEAELHVYYDVKNWIESLQWNMDFMADRAWQVKLAMGYDYEEEIDGGTATKSIPGTPGIIFHGPVDQDTLALDMLKSNLLLYPCDTVQPTEGFCITIAEGLAAGCGVVTTNCDAMNELWSKYATVVPLPVDDDIWAEAITRLLTEDELREQHAENWRAGSKYVREHLRWDEIASVWQNRLAAKLREKKRSGHNARETAPRTRIAP